MNLVGKAGETARFVGRQAGFFWEIIMLKIKIIGFANKRSDLFTSLGKAVYSSNGHVGAGGEKDALIGAIKDAEREIREAEEGILSVSGKAREDWREYYARVFEGGGG
jgi:hypothetical protein